MVATFNLHVVALILARACCLHGKRPVPDLFRRSQLVVEIRRLETCNASNNAMTLSNVSTKMQGRVNFVIDADASFSRSAKDLKEVEIVLTKCREAVTANSCEYYETWRFKDNLCKHFKSPEMPWNAAIRSVTPSFDCPPKKGVYRMRNGTMDVNMLKVLLPMEGNIWLGRMTLKEDAGTMYSCSLGEMATHHVRL